MDKKQKLWVLTVQEESTHDIIVELHTSKAKCIRSVEAMLDDCKKPMWKDIKEALQKTSYYVDDETEEIYEIRKCPVKG